jgi:hypothetical protein
MIFPNMLLVLNSINEVDLCHFLFQHALPTTENMITDKINKINDVFFLFSMNVFIVQLYCYSFFTSKLCLLVCPPCPE